MHSNGIPSPLALSPCVSAVDGTMDICMPHVNVSTHPMDNEQFHHINNLCSTSDLCMQNGGSTVSESETDFNLSPNQVKIQDCYEVTAPIDLTVAPPLNNSHLTVAPPLNNSHLTNQPTGSHVFHLERTEISRLNNMNYNRLYIQALQKLISARSNIGRCGLLDFCGGLSPLCIQMMKSGVGYGTILAREGLHPLLRELAIINEVDLQSVHIMDPQNMSDMDSTVEFHVLACDIVEPCGVLKQQILEDIALLR